MLLRETFCVEDVEVIVLLELVESTELFASRKERLTFPVFGKRLGFKVVLKLTVPLPLKGNILETDTLLGYEKVSVLLSRQAIEPELPEHA